MTEEESQNIYAFFVDLSVSSGFLDKECSRQVPEGTLVSFCFYGTKDQIVGESEDYPGPNKIICVESEIEKYIRMTADMMVIIPSLAQQSLSATMFIITTQPHFNYCKELFHNMGVENHLLVEDKNESEHIENAQPFVPDNTVNNSSSNIYDTNNNNNTLPSYSLFSDSIPSSSLNLNSNINNDNYYDNNNYNNYNTIPQTVNNNYNPTQNVVPNNSINQNVPQYNQQNANWIEVSLENAKPALQYYFQKNKLISPDYHVTAKGAEHSRLYDAEIRIEINGEIVIGNGTSSKKIDAEKKAAKNAVEKLVNVHLKNFKFPVHYGIRN